MKHFWNFQDSTGGDAADLYIYGPIVSSASWWDDSIDAVQFSEDLKALGDKDVTVHINLRAAMSLPRTQSTIS